MMLSRKPCKTLLMIKGPVSIELTTYYSVLRTDHSTDLFESAVTSPELGSQDRSVRQEDLRKPEMSTFIPTRGFPSTGGHTST